MNFELKTASLDQMDNPAYDALVVVTDGVAAAGGGALSTLVRNLRSDGELQDKVGKWVSMYRPATLAVRRLVAVSCGQGRGGAGAHSSEGAGTNRPCSNR